MGIWGSGTVQTAQLIRSLIELLSWTDLYSLWLLQHSAVAKVKESLKMANISALILLTSVTSLVFAEEQKEMEEEDPFTFDYHRLRVGGLILAAVLCLIGITILFSGHCRCKFNQDKRRRSGSNAAQPLNDQARASEC
ncbi:phospholemman-like isoform X1 [Salvelinus namaycush]|uniref:FXYD domain-containing ion transport regulator n=4 Tax=Salmoninae TaxID=504568 RepID=A0A8U0QTZ5_SALNM|nr:phospholemman-like isoform X1 [Salvelinus namaycush]